MRKLLFALLVTGLMAGAAHAAQGQGLFGDEPSTARNTCDLFGGFFSGDMLLRDTIDGDAISFKAKDGTIIGGRLGQDWEYLGYELSVGGAFSDLKVQTSGDLDTSGDASMFLTGLNLLVYPTGNTFMEGRLRPYLTFGPGLAWLVSDQKYLDDDFLIDVNGGMGVKFQPGKLTDPFFRVDFKWHRFFQGSNVQDLYRQELTFGVGIPF